MEAGSSAGDGEEHASSCPGWSIQLAGLIAAQLEPHEFDLCGTSEGTFAPNAQFPDLKLPRLMLAGPLSVPLLVHVFVEGSRLKGAREVGQNVLASAETRDGPAVSSREGRGPLGPCPICTAA